LKVRTATHLQWRYDEYRQALWRYRLGRCGECVFFGSGVVFSSPERVIIGDHVSFAANSVLWGDGGLTIGSHVLISANCSIATATHPMDLDDRATGRIVAAPVEIEDHVMIGAGAVVLPGVTVGRGAIVGAGAVVTRDVAPLTTVVGVPARPIGTARD